MKICVLGCGAYGTALSTILNENKNEVTMWTAFEEEKNILNKKRITPKLPGIKIPREIKITTDLEEASQDSDFILIAIPTAFVSKTLEDAKEYIKDKPIIIASKGIEQKSCLFISEIVNNILNTDNIAAISGPSFAIDVANKIPVALTLASQNKKTTDLVKKAFQNNHFKLRTCKDVIGIEICGAIKNVIAIASGMLDGMKMEESTKAMFLTESIHDIKKLIKDLKADENTVLSYAGIGDLILTATSPKSRNYSFGKLIGEGASKEEINTYIENTTIEGLYTLKSIKQLITEKNVEMKIIDLIDEIIYKDKTKEDLIKFLIQK